MCVLSVRFANHETHALMELMAAIRMPSAFTLDTSVTLCTVVNVNQAMLEMALSVEKTQI